MALRPLLEAPPQPQPERGIACRSGRIRIDDEGESTSASRRGTRPRPPAPRRAGGRRGAAASPAAWATSGRPRSGASNLSPAPKRRRKAGRRAGSRRCSSIAIIGDGPIGGDDLRQSGEGERRRIARRGDQPDRPRDARAASPERRARLSASRRRRMGARGLPIAPIQKAGRRQRSGEQGRLPVMVVEQEAGTRSSDRPPTPDAGRGGQAESRDSVPAPPRPASPDPRRARGARPARHRRRARQARRSSFGAMAGDEQAAAAARG